MTGIQNDLLFQDTDFVGFESSSLLKGPVRQHFIHMVVGKGTIGLISRGKGYRVTVMMPLNPDLRRFNVRNQEDVFTLNRNVAKPKTGAPSTFSIILYTAYYCY